MSAIREIKDRMTGIQSTMKITKAMYMISSTKMNAAKQSLMNTEPYFYNLRKVILLIPFWMIENMSKMKTKEKPLFALLEIRD